MLRTDNWMFNRLPQCSDRKWPNAKWPWSIVEYCGILWMVAAILASQEIGSRSWEAKVWNQSHKNIEARDWHTRKHTKLPWSFVTRHDLRTFRCFAMADVFQNVDLATASAEQLEQLAAGLTSTERSNLQKALQLLASRNALTFFHILTIFFGYFFCTFALKFEQVSNYHVYHSLLFVFIT